MLPHRVCQGNRANCWKTIVTPASGLSTLSPSISTSPRVSRTRPAALRSGVVLPQPEGPMMVPISRSGPVRAPSRSAARRLAQQIGRQLSTSPGALEVQLLQGLPRPDHIEVISTWESPDAYERAWHSPGLVAARREMEELLASPIDDRLHHAMPETAARRSGD